MKIKMLHIREYKNLKDLTINFLNQQSYINVFIGKNGSGKSNLLEAISAIFASLFDPKIKSDIFYAIEYEINNHTVFIEFLINWKCKVDEVERNHTYLINNDLLPSKVIAVYSGEELRMWEKYFFPYYERYVKSILDGNVKSSEFRLMYINKYYWNIALLTLLLSELEYNKQFIKNDLKIESLTSVKFQFNDENIKRNRDAKLKRFLDGIKEKNDFQIDELRNNIKLIDCEYDSCHFDEAKINELEVFENLMKAFMPKDFKTIENITIKFNGEITVEDLSEGEKKRLLIKLVLGILADENSLVLFDEPDAFLHPSWQRNLIEYIKENGERKTVILTTHSSNVIADMNNENVYIMADGKVCENTNKTLGRDVNSIQLEIMDTPIRNEKAEKMILEIYDLINRGDLDAAEENLNDLAKTQMGDNDTEIIKLRTMIDFEREFK